MYTKLGKKAEAPIREIVLDFIRESNGMYAFGQIINILTGSLKSEEKYEGEYFAALPKPCIGLIIKSLKNLERDGEIYYSDGKFYVANDNQPLSDNKKKFFERKPRINEIVENDDIEDNDNEDLQKIINLIKAGENVFITGHAGTGKSYILNKLKQKFPKLAITSTTGIAAVNVGGQTLHSWAGIGVCRLSIESCAEKILTSKHTIKHQIRKCKILAIDEISMLNYETLEYVDEIFKIVREDDRPFGGIQVIFIGDFFQLPPVNKEDEELHYCFESPVWQELNLKTVLLTKNYRQNEEHFIRALSHLRTNNLTDEDIDLFHTCDVIDDYKDMLHIFSTNQEADGYNDMMFDAIPSLKYKFVARDEVARDEEFVNENLTPNEERTLEFLNQNCRVDKIIYIKVGCRVMLLINMDFERGLINGSVGEVIEIGDGVIVVRFDNGEIAPISREKFEYFKHNKVQARRRQFPLRLAYGITIHKSQGMTLDKLYVDCKKIFERGQAYVALSRLKTLDGLYLKNFSPSLVMTDPKVVKFYENLICE